MVSTMQDNDHVTAQPTPVRQRAVMRREPVQRRSTARVMAILDACAALGIDTPTLCYGETLRPANVCRVCVVELEGSRGLAPACSRKV